MPEDVVLVPVHTEKVEEWWPKILPWAEEFCKHSQGSYDAEYILDKLQQSLMQLWVVEKCESIIAVCLTEIRRTKIRECVIVVMTGDDMDSWVNLLKLLEKYAKDIGCSKMVGIARPGWERILKPYGYKKTHVQVERDL